MGAGDLVGGEGPVRPKDTFANLMTCLRVLAIVVVHLLAESPRIVGALIRRRPADVEIGIGRALASAAEALGPLFVKLAQMVSYRIDLLPAALVGQMARLQDRVGHRGGARALREFIEGPLQRSLGGRVLAIDVNPFASGSIATVHRGRMHDGASVAVKIVRRGVADRLRRDTECARWIIGFVARAKFLKGIPVVATFDQLARIIRSQADMLSEARTLARFRDGFSGERGPRVPKVYDEYTTRDLLVMELIEGASLFSDRLDERDFREVARQILAALYHMIFVDGLVHCDVHPGNLLVDVAQKRAILLDGGLAAELTEADRVCFRDLFFGLASCDSAACARAIVSSALVVPADLNRTALEKDVAPMVRSYFGRKVGEFLIADFVSEIFRIQRRHGLFAAPGFASAIWALVMFEGLVRWRYPDLDFQSEARTFATAAILADVRRYIGS